MAKSSSTSSRFVPINLHRSYDSASNGHGASSSSSFRQVGYSSVNRSSSPSPSPSPSPSSSSAFRHSGSVPISRSSSMSIRSQTAIPSSSSSLRSSSFKLSIPRPVNLPSLRREHSGNDPAIALVGGATGSSGWSKKQQSSVTPSTEVYSSAIDNDNSASTKFSSWSFSYQRITSAANSATFQPNESRHASPGPAVVVRGEDFPTLQASSATFPYHRKEGKLKQRDKQLEPEDHQHKQRDKQLRIEDHQSNEREKLQEPEDHRLKERGKQQEHDHHWSIQLQQGDILDKSKEHVSHQDNPKLQSLSTELRFKQPLSGKEHSYEADDTLSSSRYEGSDDAVVKTSTYKGRGDIGKSSYSKAHHDAINKSNHYEDHDVTVKSLNHCFSEPSPLVSLGHTLSNWVDDERETLGSALLEGLGHVNQLESRESTSATMISNRVSHDSTHLIGSFASRNRPTSGSQREFRDLQGNAEWEGRSTKDISSCKDPAGLDWHGSEASNVNQNAGRNDIPRRDWGSLSKDVCNKRGTRFASNRSFSNRNNYGYGRDSGSNSYRDDVDSVNNLGMNPAKLESSSQDIFLRKDFFPNKNNLYRGQGRSSGNLQFSRSSVNTVSGTYSSPRDGIPGLNYRREERTHGLYKQDSIFGSSRNAQANSFFDVDSVLSSIGVKMFRKKKDEPINYNDPAREQFEAELERVQKLQEQERQKAIEERERAIELAVKEAEEQEKLAREEELFRLKLEEEAREAAAKAQREIEEAEKMTKELRRAREEEKQMALVEEERRKEAARRKLMELEERISKRESMQKQRDSFVSGTNSDVNYTKVDEANTRFSKMERKDKSAPFKIALPLPSPAKREEREVPENLSSQTMFPLTQRDTVMQINKTASLDDVIGFSSLSLKSDDGSQIVHELGYKDFSLKDSVIGLSNGYKQNEPMVRKQRRWGSNQSEGLMGRNLSSDTNAGYQDDTKYWRGEGWGGNHNDLQEKRWSSPSIPYYLNGGETDYPVVGRLRQSLPKQPRVPPPIIGHGSTTIRKKVPQAESNHSEGLLKDTGVQESPIKIETQYRSLTDPQSSESLTYTISTEVSLLPKLQILDNGVENGLVHVSEEYQDLCSDENEISSEVTGSIKRIDDDETQMAAVMMEEKHDGDSADDEWLAKTTEGELNALKLHNSSKMETVDVSDDDDEWENVNILVVKGNEHTAEILEENHMSHQIDEIRNHGTPDGAERLIDSQWERNTVFISKREAPMLVTIKDEALQDPKIDQAPLQQRLMSAADITSSMRMGSEGLNINQPLFQQFQQPFSFMAVPLPQSTTLNSVAPHQSMLHSLHVQQDLPFQMGLLPNIPNAIQIGSIQMPLQVHPQMTQIAHLHQQPPVFQFGQICHSVPFNQPIPYHQPTDQIYHMVDQASNHHIESLAAVLDGPLGSTLGLQEVDEKASAEKEIAVETDRPIEENIQVKTEEKVLSSDEQNECEFITSKTILQDLDELETSSPFERGNADTLVNQSSLVDRLGSRSEYNHSTDYGVFGKGHGRMHGGNGYKTPYSISQTWTGNGEEEGINKRISRRSNQQTEYRARKPLPDIDSSNGANMNEARDLMSRHHASTELDTASLNTSIKRKPNMHAHNSGTYIYVKTQGYSDALNNGTSQDSLSTLPGSWNCLVNSQMNHVQSKGISKFDAAEETIFEEPDTETHINDDFIEVRSKRQMLKEQHELRDNEKPRDFKVKEQRTRNQQQLVANEPAIADKKANEQWSTPCIDTMKYGMQANESICPPIPQYSVACSLGGISTPEICDDINENTKIVTSGQSQSTSNVSHTNPGAAKDYGHQFYSDVAGDSTCIGKNVTTAWGGQQYPHEVVSLTQIQLEEAMKPIQYEGISSQMEPIMEGSCTTIGPGISASLAPMNASVSMPNPISSLLAGEKIQFGAVTSPTVISCDNRSSSPSFIGTVGTRLGYAVDIDTNIATNPLNFTRSFTVTEKNRVFASSTTETKVYNQVVDAEAEAEAAASAVAVAAISSDEMVGSHSDAETVAGSGSHVGGFASFSSSSGIEVTRPAIIQAPTESVDIEDSISAALPVDLSVETPSLLMSGSMPNVGATAGFMLANFPNRVSPFSCLEMGTILGGSIFTFGHRDEALTAPLEPGSVAGWQQMQSSTSDSFYSPSQPFMRPTGIPNIQGHPHMLVYTNPFTPVGQFGQLGVSFMGTAYHPSGKQPDWTHTPFTSPLGTAYQNAGDVNAGFTSTMDPQYSTATSNSVQSFSVAGCSMMPMAAPIGLFDPNLSTPFQAQWSRAPAPPFANYPFSGQAPSFNLQSRGLSTHLGEYGLMHQPFHMSYNTHHHHHQHHQSLDANSSPFLQADIASVPAVHFSDEIGLGYSVTTVNAPPNNMNLSATKGDSNLSLAEEKRNMPP